MNLILKKEADRKWVLYSDKGFKMYEIPAYCSSDEQAMKLANAWASSWHSVNIKAEDGQSIS